MMSELRTGEKAKIIDLSHVSRLVQKRLLNLGFTVGSEVCVKCAMPFGGPIMLESSGQSIGIRRNEAERIQVERL